MDDDKRIDDDSILGNSGGISEASSTDSGADTSNETDSEYITGEEAINNEEARAIETLPNGCNVFYGTYVDNYNGNTRTRYYFDSYGQLIESQRVANVNRPTGVVCMTEMPMSHNKDMGIIMAEVCAAVAIYLAVKFVVGRLIK